jgi:hypothetical protein
MTTTLPAFEGTDVYAASMKITKAGDGLSDALEVAPVALHVGDEVYFVLKGVVEQVNHRPLPKADGLQRVHTIATTDITQVDETAVGSMLTEATERVRREKERAEGISTLEDARLEAEHNDGAHADGLVAGCPRCDAEVAAEAKEKRERKAK